MIGGRDGIPISYNIERCARIEGCDDIRKRITGTLLPWLWSIFGSLERVDIEGSIQILGHIIHMRASWLRAINAQVSSFMQVEHETRHHCHRYTEEGKRWERTVSWDLNVAFRTCWRTWTNRLGERATLIIWVRSSMRREEGVSLDALQGAMINDD